MELSVVNDALVLTLVSGRKTISAHLASGCERSFFFRVPVADVDAKLGVRTSLSFEQADEYPHLRPDVSLVLGRDFFKAHLLRVERSRAASILSAPPDGARRVPCTGRGGFMHVNVAVNGHPMTALLDTGAASGACCIDGAAFDSMGLVPLPDVDGPEAAVWLTLFDTQLRVRMVRRGVGDFSKRSSQLTGVSHLCSVGGSALFRFDMVFSAAEPAVYVR